MGLPYLLPRRLQVDPYGPNPLVSDLSATNRPLFDLASQRGAAPTLFASGDLPPFTASGVDPAVLNGLPYHWRHAAASEANPATVLDWLEQCAMDHNEYGQGDPRSHPGYLDYQGRVQTWVRDLETPEPSFEDATYPEWMKSPATRKAEAAAAAAAARRAEEQRLTQKIADLSSQYFRDDNAIGALVDQLAALRSQR